MFESLNWNTTGIGIRMCSLYAEFSFFNFNFGVGIQTVSIFSHYFKNERRINNFNLKFRIYTTISHFVSVKEMKTILLFDIFRVKKKKVSYFVRYTYVNRNVPTSY